MRLTEAIAIFRPRARCSASAIEPKGIAKAMKLLIAWRGSRP
jgi:hypothetical protein